MKHSILSTVSTFLTSIVFILLTDSLKAGNVSYCDPDEFGDPILDQCVNSCSPSKTQSPSDRVCEPCLSPCSTCSFSQTTCTSCSSSSKGANSNCKCNTKCSSCSSGNSNHCYGCTSSSHLLVNYTGDCVTSCPTAGYYQNGGNCSQCHNYCSKCSGGSNTQCSACKHGKYKDGTTCSTSCPSGKTQNPSNGLCTTCLGDCNSCSTTPTACLSCKNGKHLSNGLCISQCPLPEVQSPSNNICQSCSPGCTSCQTTPNNCLSCSLVKFKENNSCLDQCSTNRVQSPTNKQCELCQGDCLTCQFIPTQCTSCKNGLFLKGNSCLSQCPALETQNPADFTCRGCDSICKTCQNTSSSCSSCHAPNFLHISSCIPNCPSRFFEDKTTSIWKCSSCDSTCLECSNLNSDNCLKCDSKSSTAILFQNQCLSVCPNGYYYAGLDPQGNGKCNSCDSSCFTCSSLQPLLCVNCKPGKIINRINVVAPYRECRDTCPQGSFNQSGECAPCDSSCQNCVDLSAKCTSCPFGKLLQDNVCVIQCAQGYFESGILCLPCDLSCQSCQNRSDFCLVCSDPSMFLDDGNCLESCTERKVQDPPDHICISCQLPCHGCIETTTKCLSCEDSANLHVDNFECIQTPKFDYFLEQSAEPAKEDCDIRLTLQVLIPEESDNGNYNFEKFGRKQLFEVVTSSQASTESITVWISGNYFDIYIKTTDKSDLNSIRVTPLVESFLLLQPPIKLLNKETTVPIESYYTLSPQEIEEQEQLGETMKSVTGGAEALSSTGVAFATLLPMDPTGTLAKSAQTLNLLGKLKYIKIDFGQYLGSRIRGKSKMIKKHRTLLEEGKGNLEGIQQSSKAKLNSYGLTLYFEGAPFYKLIAYIVSWALKLIGIFFLKKMTKDKMIVIFYLRYLKIQRKVHFLVFTIGFTDITFYGTRVFLHVKINQSTFWIKSIVTVVYVLLVLDFLQIFDRALSLSPTIMYKNMLTPENQNNSQPSIPKQADSQQGSPLQNQIMPKNRKRQVISTRSHKAQSIGLKNMKSPPSHLINNDKLQNQTRKTKRKPSLTTVPSKNVSIRSTKDKSVSPVLPSQEIDLVSLKPKKIIDFEKTLLLASHNIEIDNFLKGELKSSSFVLTQTFCKLNNFTFILKTAVFQILIIAFPHLPQLQLLLLLITEFGYLAFTIIAFVKYKHLNSYLLLISKIIQSFFLLGLFFILLTMAFRYGSQPSQVTKSTQGIAVFFKTGILISELLFLVLKLVMSWVIIFKNRKVKKFQIPLVIYKYLHPAVLKPNKGELQKNSEKKTRKRGKLLRFTHFQKLIKNVSKQATKKALSNKDNNKLYSAKFQINLMPSKYERRLLARMNESDSSIMNLKEGGSFE